MAINPGEGALNFEIIRITIELDSAFLIGTGDGDGLHDAVFVTDANGLPAIPGDTLAGVLRHALAGADDPNSNERCRRAFGFQDPSGGAASRIQVSWGQVHGRADRPVPFLGAVLDDPVLAFLGAGVSRDHVRIGPHGAVDERGKFDELLVPAGARFTFEVTLFDDCPINTGEVLAALNRPEVALGKATRRGLGAFHVVRAVGRTFDLREPSSRERLGALPVGLHEEVPDGLFEPLAVSDVARATPRLWVTGRLELTPIGTWMFGGTIPGGAEPPPSYNRDGSVDATRSPDRFALVERHVVWQPDSKTTALGSVVDLKNAAWLIPASSVKGAVRHRTSFHCRRQRKEWLDSDTELKATPSEVALFGEVSNSADSRGVAGRVMVGDTRVLPSQDVKVGLLQHVGLDRFTQGPLDGRLFSEAPLFGGKLSIPIAVRVDDGLDGIARQAFEQALEDLCKGRLALGSARGHGRFRGKVEWEDKGEWLREGVTR